MAKPTLWDPALRVHGQPVLVACSGGADSTALALLAVAQGAQVQLAHMNYGLRGADSEADQAFVEDLARQLGVPCHVTRVTLPEKPERGLQAEARRVRYRWLRDLAQSLGIGIILTAHHQDDVAETALLHLIRGHGPLLKGIRPVWVLAEGFEVWRPLLHASKAALVAYLQQRNQPWREDVSNATDVYLRNIVRHQVLPGLTAVHPQAAAQLAQRARQAQELEAALVALLPDPLSIWQAQQDRLALRFEVLRTQLPARAAQQAFLRHTARHLLHLPAKQADLFPDLLQGPMRRVRIGAWRIWRRSDRLWIRAAGLASVVLQEGEQVWHGQTLHLRCESALGLQLPPRYGEVWLAADDPAPFIARSWRPGDEIQPLGMAGHRKVADVLNDLGVPGWRKRHHLVITQNDQVVYVAGYRIAERHRVTPQTQRVCVLRVS